VIILVTVTPADLIAALIMVGLMLNTSWGLVVTPGHVHRDQTAGGHRIA
jgi:hypothetical protein